MNKGFFFTEEVIEPKRKKVKNEKIKKKKKKVDLCEKCRLYKTCITPKMQYTGEGLKKILIVGEAPGKNEDEKGVQFIGNAGQTLREMLEKLDIDLDTDCWKTNAIICRPQNNKTPTIAQVNYCRSNLEKTINELQPDKILTFGKVALQGVIGNRLSVNNINRWVGWKIPDQYHSCFVFPNFHPQFLNYNKKNKVLHKKFAEYLKTSIKWNKKFSKLNIDNVVNICNEEEAYKHLYNLQSLKEETIAFDFETTGLKPHRLGHEIVTISITQSNYFTFAFSLTEKLKPLVIQILRNENIKKIAHNLQFENRWSRFFLSNITNWYFDTQLSSHILDNRSEITSLKFQVYINFGISGYDDTAKEYISSKEKGGNEFNTMKDMNPEERSLYCGLDSYFTMKLYKLHDKKLDNHLRKGFDLFLEANKVLSQLSGIRFDANKYNKNYKEITDSIDNLHSQIMSSKEVKKLKDPDNFNLKSSKQLRELLYDVCKWETKNTTDSGLKSVDEKTLLEFDKRFTNNILKKRKLLKVRDTYLAQFKREAVEQGHYTHFIYPFFGLNIPVTYRGSSYNPNYQNIPVRDEFAKKITRSCIIPRKDRSLLEIDFKGMEVSTSCCYHEDPVMIDYVENPKNDMHRDVCLDLFLRTLDTFTKDERFIGKNGFTFPEFYGSTCRMITDEEKERGYGEVTKNIYEMTSEKTKNHLAKNGLSSIIYFQEHVEKIEEKFWNERFQVYQEWKFNNWKEYKKKGYIELLTGFRCTGIMGFNDVNNYPIQGSAFHILLWCLIELYYYLEKNCMESVIIGQIHDSIVIDLEPSEREEVITVIKYIATKKVREHWKWIIVPLVIEAEITKVNDSWDNKEEIKIF